MSLRNRSSLPVAFSAIALFALAVLAGCGSSSNKATPPPTGGFTNANFSGAYVFSFAGTDYTDVDSIGDSGTFFAVAGALTASPSSGSTTAGTLSGTIDVNDPQLAAAIGGSTSPVQTAVSVTGNYNVTADGRGSGTLAFSFGGANTQFGIDFVLTTSSHGLITRFDTNGTGSGTIDAQTSGVTQSALSGSYSFALNGVDDSGNPLGSVGTVSLGSSGGVTSGQQDFNDNGNSTNLAALPIATSSGVFVPVSGAAAGTATLSNSSSLFPSLNFDVWIIDSTHLKLIETDGAAVLAGDAYVSTGQSFPSGNLAYTMYGFDDDEDGPLAIGGLVTTSSGSVTSGLQNWNDAGNPGNGAPSGSYATSGGRTALSLSGFFNGGWGQSSETETGTYTFAAYPYSYGTGGTGAVLLEVDSLGGVSAGTAYLQSSTSFASGQGYGLNLSGENESSEGEVDMIAEFTVTSSSDITGLYDANFSGSIVPDYNLNTDNNASYTVNSNGQGTLTFPSLQNPSSDPLPALSLTFYTVDGTNVAFIETDSDQVAAGSFQLQNASGSSAQAAVLPQFAMARPGVTGKAAKSRLKK
jgi:hypothetical protein